LKGSLKYRAMINLKIYLDTDPVKGEVIIFEAAGKESTHLSLAKNIYDKSGRLRYAEPLTTVIYAGNIAISPEARAAFMARFNDKTSYDVIRYGDGDFQMSGCQRETHGGFDPGRFAFRPDEGEHYPRRRSLGINERFVLSVDGGLSFSVFDYMTEADNELLKNLDLSEPLDDSVIHQKRLDDLRAKGEEPPVTVEAIRKTPLRFLTDAQKAKIKREYHNDCDRYDSQDWHYHGDFIYDKIVSDLAERFNKSFIEIEAIIK